jgi:hypothetical protein
MVPLTENTVPWEMEWLSLEKMGPPKGKKWMSILSASGC